MWLASRAAFSRLFLSLISAGFLPLTLAAAFFVRHRGIMYLVSSPVSFASCPVFSSCV